LQALAQRLADGTVCLDAGADRDEAEAQLVAVPGIGPWTAHYLRMRALSDPDVFLATDLAVKAGATRLGLPSDQRSLEAVAQRWRPWRSYALRHVWHASAA
jgi:AraC family transcriptional regulator of adaptative response / DNA-3-methyladenine glycosylase II